MLTWTWTNKPLGDRKRPNKSRRRIAWSCSYHRVAPRGRCSINGAASIATKMGGATSGSATSSDSLAHRFETV